MGSLKKEEIRLKKKKLDLVLWEKIPQKLFWYIILPMGILILLVIQFSVCK